MICSPLLRASLLLMLLPVTACVDEEGADVGEAAIALTGVPDGVQCIHIDVAAGDGVEGHSFPVTSGTSPVTLALGALPTGLVQFTGTAHDAACPDAVSAPVGDPTWIAAPIVAEIVPGLPETLAFEFRRNEPGSGTAEFQDSAISIAPGGLTTLAVMADGSLRGWGTAYAGDLGTGSVSESPKAPRPAGFGLGELVGVAAASYRGCGWSETSLWCWGANWYGMIGDGTTTQRNTPVLVSGNWAWSTIVDVEMTTTGTCLLAADGRAYCWGANGSGEIGRSSPAGQNFLTPQSIQNSYEVISMGQNFVCGIALSGTVECWGSNSSLQLGLPASTPSSSNVVATTMRGAVDLAAGYGHVCAVRADGTVWCWGRNSGGELGGGTAGGPIATPVQVVGITTATAVAVTQTSSCALLADATVACWGDNTTGQLGNGTGSLSYLPVAVRDLAGVVELRGSGPSGGTMCATLADGEGRCWGAGTYGQIGDGVRAHRFAPTKVAF